MFLPVVLCGSVRTAAFSPTQLSGYVNSPYNIALLRSQGKLWQDTAMTVAAVDAGDPVRRIDCGGTYYDAPSDAARPLLYSEGSGKWSLSFDGVDDNLVSPSRSWMPAKRGAFFLRSTNTASAFGTVAATYAGTTPDFQLGLRNRDDGSGSIWFYDGVSSKYIGTSIPTGYWTWGLVRSADTTLDAYFDTTTAVSATCTNNQAAANTLSIGKPKNFPSELFSGHIAGWLALDAAPGVSDVTALMAYLAALAPSTPPFPESLTGYVDSPYNIALLRLHGNLWQDTTFTTRATVDGDPVRRIVCGSTYYDAPSDAARPLLYSEGGGKWSLSFDGVDDYLAGATVTGWQNAKSIGLLALFQTGGFRAACGQGVSDATEEVIIGRLDGGDGYMDVGDGLGPFVVPAGLTGGAYCSTVWVQSTSAGTTTLSCYQSATLLSGAMAGAARTPNAATGQPFLIGLARSAAPQRMLGRIAGLAIYTTSLGTTDRAALDTYLAALRP